MAGGWGAYFSGGSRTGHSINYHFFKKNKYLSFALGGLKLSILHMASLSSPEKLEVNLSIYSLDQNYGGYTSPYKTKPNQTKPKQTQPPTAKTTNQPKPTKGMTQTVNVCKKLKNL